MDFARSEHSPTFLHISVVSYFASVYVFYPVHTVTLADMDTIELHANFVIWASDS